MADVASQGTIRCPTCGAQQSPSGECRRCKCDLELVVALHERRWRLRDECLRQLASGDLAGAIATARQGWQIQPDPEFGRLLTVAYLLSGRYQAALEVRQRLLSSSSTER